MELDYNSFSSLLKQAFTENNLLSLFNDELSNKLFLLFNHLSEESAKYNLTAIKDPKGIVYKHFVDSLLVSSSIPHGGRIIDVGCGAGFPSLPLAAARPDLKIVAIDSTDKKISFVKSCISRLELNNIAAITARAESVDIKELRGTFDVAVARAVASLPVLSELCIPFLRTNGYLIAMKGRDGTAELIQSASALKTINAGNQQIISYKLIISEESEERTIISIQKLGKTPDNFPRNYARIIKKPLS